MHSFRDDPSHSLTLASVRLAVHAAYEISSLPLSGALRYLEMVRAVPLLSDELRERTRETALRVAEAAVHLECLRDLFEMDDRKLPNGDA